MIQQTYSKFGSKRRAINTCILNTFAGRLLDRVNGVLLCSCIYHLARWPRAWTPSYLYCLAKWPRAMSVIIAFIVAFIGDSIQLT